MRFEALALDAPSFDALVEDLRFRFHKWDAYLSGTLRVLPDALLLSRAEHDDAVACCLAVNRALERVVSRLRDDPAVLERLAIPRKVHDLIRGEVEHPYQIARYDLIPTESGWMIPEFNEDAPGGFNESVAGNALFPAALASGRVAGDFAQAFLDGMPKGRRCGLIYATGYAEDLQHMLVLADLLRSRGVEAILGSPDQLSCGPFGRPRLQGVGVDWILRFFPGEWYAHLADLRAWQRAVRRVPVVNPIGRLLRQSKGLYALWREDPRIDEADRAVLNRYTPHTAFFSHDAVPELMARREDWVLKQTFGRMGDAVVIGRRLSGEDWRKAIAEALKRPGDHIIQRAFTPLSYPSAIAGAQFPALGVYLINGAFAGYYSRSDETGFTTHEAHYVVTAVESP